MSFSKDVKTEIINKCFTLKKKHSRIQDGLSLEKNKELLARSFVDFGILCDPQKMYLLEFVSSDHGALDSVKRVLSETLHCEDSIKQTNRAGAFVLYIQDADVISDFLSFIGAHHSMLEYENMRILKEMRENIQRTVNCETANIKRTVRASSRQISDIEYIEENIGIDNIPDPLREMAEVRLAKPEASLKELAESFVPPIGRSGVNHRLRKISNIVEEHKRLNLKEYKNGL